MIDFFNHQYRYLKSCHWSPLCYLDTTKLYFPPLIGTRLSYTVVLVYTRFHKVFIFCRHRDATCLWRSSNNLFSNRILSSTRLRIRTLSSSSQAPVPPSLSSGFSCHSLNFKEFSKEGGQGSSYICLKTHVHANTGRTEMQIMSKIPKRMT